MAAPPAPTPPRDHERAPWPRSDAALLALILALTSLTAVVIFVPAIAPAVVNDRFDVAITTAALLVSAAVAVLAWGRGRVGNEGAALLRSSAFAVLAMLNGIVLVAGLTGADAGLGATLESPGQLPLLAGLVARGMCSVLLVGAGWAALRGWSRRISPLGVALWPAAVVLSVLTAATVVADRLPALASPAALELLAQDPTQPLAAGTAPGLVIANSLIAAAFLVAALLAYRAYQQSRRAGDAFMAGGFIIAAFSQVHSAIHPGSYATVVTTGDMLRLGFYLFLLIGIFADSRDDLAELRAANLEVRRLAEAEVATAALEERARLAREIHDGLAQDLWYAKLKQGRLSQVAALEGESQRLSDEVASALDNALAEARNAMAAMRGGSESGPLLDLLAGVVEDFGDRFALRAELTSKGQAPEIGPRAQAEVVRIVQEALTNVRKHADATVVRVSVEFGDDLRITVSDNGRGFHPEASTRGFGLDSMRQRATLIGATLTISSKLRDGSRVELRIPREPEREESDAG
jgi:signal transduction histidine kinase